MTLDTLMQHVGIWRGVDDSRLYNLRTLPTGYPGLDAHLPGTGWPLGVLTEILFDAPGIGELGLLLPGLADINRRGQHMLWIDPPYLPCAPALAAAGLDLSRLVYLQTDSTRDSLWAMEQALRSDACGAVLCWSMSAELRSLRRLQLAAEAGSALAVLFRPLAAAEQASPAKLRIRLAFDGDGICLQILKRPGGWPMPPLPFDHPHALA